MKTLKQLYKEHNGKLSDKWSLYLTELDRLFSPYRNRPIRLLEIGIQNGGSLEIWRKYFPNAEKIIGCDIDPKCATLRYRSARIAIVVADANSDQGQKRILRHTSTFDIIIDDGSHKSSDIVRSFARYFPHLRDGGIYVAEDLHSSYWNNFGGGLHDPLSAMSFFKRLVDIINHEHWRNNQLPADLVARFGDEYNTDFGNLDFARIHSIEFINSLCLIRKSSPSNNQLGKRVIVGTKEQVTSGFGKYNGTSIQDLAVDIKNDGNLDVFNLIARNEALEQSLQNLAAQVIERDQSIQNLVTEVAKRDQSIAERDQSIVERDQSIQNITIQLMERDRSIRKLTARVAERDKSLQNLITEVAKRDQSIVERDQSIQKLTAQVAERDQELSEIKMSKAWKLTLLFRRIRIWIAPPGSRQAEFIRKRLIFFSPQPKVIEKKTKADNDWILIQSSGLFDETWYLAKNPDVAKSNIDPLTHYLLFGGSEGRDPGPNFSSALYLNTYEDVKEAGMNPLVHFLRYGKSEGRLGNLDGMSEYERWILMHEPKVPALNKQRECANLLSVRPRVDLVLLAFNSQVDTLENLVESVLDQTYDNWQLHLLIRTEQSTLGKYLQESLGGKDRRIQVVPWSADTSPTDALNHFLTTGVTGEFVAFLENGGTLAPFALFEITNHINELPTLDLIYSDEDKITEWNGRFDPFFKPDYSPDTLRSINYMRHFLVIRKTLGDQIGWFRDSLGDAQYYDLVLRATEQSKNILHISKVLYHSRPARDEDVELVRRDGNSNDQALQEHLDRCKLPGSITAGNYPETYRVTHSLPESPVVSIIIPNRDNAQYLSRAIHSILDKSTYSNFEILIIENNSREPETFQLYEQLQALDGRVSILTQNAPFNFSSINNWAAGMAKGKILLFLNNDVEVISFNWLEEMLQHSLRPNVGVVGAKLYYSDETIQHAGIILGHTGGIALHEHLGAQRESTGYFGRLTYTRNVSAVTGACLMVRKEVFEEVNGFDGHYTLAYGDVDLCLKIREKGYLNVWTPFAELFHFESRTRGYEDSFDKQARFEQEIAYFLQKWDSTLKKGDPYYNEAFSMSNGDFQLKLEQ